MTGKKLLSGAAVIFILLFTACTGNAPSLNSIQWRIVLRDNGERRWEELYLFMRASDPDGEEDLAQVLVKVGDSGLQWRFGADEWISDPGGESGWQGLPPMSAARGKYLPDGLYTVQVEDLSGRNSSLTFRPDPRRMDVETAKWPQVSLEKGFVRLNPDNPSAVLILRDGSLSSLRSLTVLDGMEVDTEGASFWEVWIPLERVKSGYRLGPYPLASSAALSK
ncbi:MAG: hypothetical protein CSA76_01845 [Spirochaetales bacterium]|nr:MAG: hypothetical protein CSA76_01845 [Spirochaetales bacterium]